MFRTSRRSRPDRAAGVLAKTGRVALALWMTVAAAGAAVSDAVAQGRLAPDPELQNAIEVTVSAIVQNDEAAADHFASLRKLGGPDRAALLVQMVLYLEGVEGSDRAMAGALVLERLSFTPKEKIDAVVPLLEAANRTRRGVLSGMLGTVDRRDGGQADFSVYDAWLRGRPGRPPAAFVAYLFDSAPNDAVRLMQRVYGRPAALPPDASRAVDETGAIVVERDVSRPLTEEERARAAAALATLAADPAWWVRRYAATLLRDEPALRSPAVVDLLKSDADPLVREGLTHPSGNRAQPVAH